MAGRKLTPKFSKMSSFASCAFRPRQKADIVITQRVEVEVQARTAASFPNTFGKLAYIRPASSCCCCQPLRERSPTR